MWLTSEWLTTEVGRPANTREWSVPHVAFVPFTGFRVGEPEMLELGMTLPGLVPRAEAIGGLPALGLLTLAGMTPPPWTCSYHDAPRVTDELVDMVRARNPALVAVSALSASIHDAYDFTRRLREYGIPTIIGGLHTTAMPDEAEAHCDAVAVGDGEPIWPAILADARAGALRRRYQSRTPFNMQEAPLPRFDLLGDRVRPRMTIQTQRGCPFACEFCGASRLLGPFREKPVERIAGELARITEICPRPMIELADDNTFAGRREPQGLFDVLAESEARYFTEVDWRIGERPEILAGLAASGCVQVLIGIESILFQPAGMGAKRADLQRVMNAVGAIQESGVAVIGCFIVGCDGETESSIDQLGAFLDQCPLADVQLTVQTPFPGTALHHRLKQSGRLLPERGWDRYTLFDLTYQPDNMTVRQLETSFRDLVRQTFADEPARRRAEIRRATWRRHPVLKPCS